MKFKAVCLGHSRFVVNIVGEWGWVKILWYKILKKKNIDEIALKKSL